MQRTTADFAPSDGSRQAELVPVVWLLHTPAGAPPHALRLRPGRTLIGRDPALEVVLEDQRASRSHASLRRGVRDVVLSDEGSRHGTFVNGVRIEERVLADGDVVRCGDSHLLLRMTREPASDAPIASLVGVSPAVGELRSALARVAPHRATVLLLGESGSGKELAARAIHERSGRGGAFVAVNCAAVPSELFESQLFGHAAHAFTGARSAQLGFFRAANGGTLFLDEVGELALALQPKLLRALEERAVVPIGETLPVPCDVRLVAATNRDLAAAAASSAFRGDLYARLAELVVTLPPLRMRREDILFLLARAYGEPLPPLAPDLVAALLAHAWPYNVRELFAVARELAVHAAGATTLTLEPVRHRFAALLQAQGIETSAAAARTSEPAPARTAMRETPERDDDDSGVRGPAPTRAELEALLRASKGNVGQAARATGRSRMQVYRWIESYGIDLEALRAR